MMEQKESKETQTENNAEKARRAAPNSGVEKHNEGIAGRESQDKVQPSIQKDEKKQQDEQQKRHENSGKEDQKNELVESLQRLQADFENYKKRTEKEKALATQQATTKIIQQLLPIIDTFELALKNKGNQEQFTKGIEMIYAQLYNTLQNIGVRPINTANKKFDPHLHEVLIQEERKECDDDTIVEEFQRGYMLKDNVIRTSKVKIVKKVHNIKHDNQNNTTQHH